MNYRFYIVSHKNFAFPKDSHYIPIFVGPNNIQYHSNSVNDKEGDNIADKNPNYCELTALYWIWKNVKNVDYIGFVHYRRYFYNHWFSRNYKNLISEKRLKKYMKCYDIVLPKQNVSTLTMREEYVHDGSGLSKDLLVLQEVMSELYPEYSQDLKEVLNGHRSYLFNMFFCHKVLMDQYCEWLFHVLKEVEARVDISKYNPQQARIYGYMAERLMTVYVRHHHLKIKEVQVFNTENKYKDEFMREIKRKIKTLKY